MYVLPLLNDNVSRTNDLLVPDVSEPLTIMVLSAFTVIRIPLSSISVKVLFNKFAVLSPTSVGYIGFEGVGTIAHLWRSARIRACMKVLGKSTGTPILTLVQRNWP